MKRYRITWEERYSIEVKANSKKVAEEKWQELPETFLGTGYKETTLFEIEEN